MTRYQIEVRPVGAKFLATVSKFVSSEYDTIAAALGENEEDAIYDAVQEAFYR
jgi:hypothetical protein